MFGKGLKVVNIVEIDEMLDIGPFVFTHNDIKDPLLQGVVIEGIIWFR